jgi:hypothetical protein
VKELERHVPPFDGEPAEWEDVLMRADVRRRRLPRTLALALAVVVGLLALTVPFGLAGRVVGLFRDEGKPVPLARLTATERAELIFMFCRRIDLVTSPGKPPEKQCREGEPAIEEIARSGNRVYWKVTYLGGRTCLVSGPVRPYRLLGGRRSRFGQMRCGPNLFPTPKRPITADLPIVLKRGAPRARLLRATGLAGEGVASVGLIDESDDVLKTPVTGRVYDFGPLPDRPWVAIAAFDDSGDELYRQRLLLRAPEPPPRTLRRPPKPPRKPPLPALPKGPPLQHADAPGATIDVYRSGLVAVRLTSTTSRGYRLIRPAGTDPTVSIGCARAAYGAGRWELLFSGGSAFFGREMRMVVTGGRAGYGSPSPPFDFCTMRGKYGRRWNDARGMHDAFEFALTPLGQRFLAEQAAARDLSLFMRTPQIREIRQAMIRKAGIPGSAEIARRFPSRVVPLSERTGTPARPNIGVWSNGTDRIVAAKQAEDGRRMFVTLESGRFGPHNLARLGFLIY